MTREQVEKCNEYEQELRWAVKSNFVHMSNTEFSKIASLYKEVFGKALTVNQMTCNTCRLNAMKELGNDYFASRDKYTIEDRDKEKDTTKKKVGRPKKINIDGE